MRVFIGSSGERARLVDWLTAFIRREYPTIEPVPWTAPWTAGQFTLENIEEHIRNTDASILFWTHDDLTQYRGTERYEPRDNLVFEAGMFIASHGRERTQLLIPQLPAGAPEGRVAAPTDVMGLTWNQYPWQEDVPIETTGLPNIARLVCDRLVTLGIRPRAPLITQQLANFSDVEEIHTFAGAWSTIHSQAIAQLASNPNAQSIDILASYRVGEIRRALDDFKNRGNANLRACFANMWDVELATVYRRKFYDRTIDHMRNAVSESIQGLLGTCNIEVRSKEEIIISNVEEPPTANYNLRLTPQRITFGYYRVDDVAFIVPLDMRRSQNPAPLAWVIERQTAPRAFNYYLEEYNRMFEESLSIYSTR
jgi:hypothetical protein